jgi:hypothetical protein
MKESRLPNQSAVVTAEGSGIKAPRLPKFDVCVILRRIEAFRDGTMLIIHTHRD